VKHKQYNDLVIKKIDIVQIEKISRDLNVFISFSNINLHFFFVFSEYKIHQYFEEKILFFKPLYSIVRFVLRLFPKGVQHNWARFFIVHNLLFCSLCLYSHYSYKEYRLSIFFGSFVFYSRCIIFFQSFIFLFIRECEILVKILRIEF